MIITFFVFSVFWGAGDGMNKVTLKDLFQQACEFQSLVHTVRISEDPQANGVMISQPFNTHDHPKKWFKARLKVTGDVFNVEVMESSKFLFFYTGWKATPASQEKADEIERRIELKKNSFDN